MLNQYLLNIYLVSGFWSLFWEVFRDALSCSLPGTPHKTYFFLAKKKKPHSNKIIVVTLVLCPSLIHLQPRSRYIGMQESQRRRSMSYILNAMFLWQWVVREMWLLRTEGQHSTGFRRDKANISATCQTTWRVTIPN